MPAGFARLEICMKSLASGGERGETPDNWPDGIGFKEISPADEDSDLEDQLRAAVMSFPSTQKES